MVITIPGRLILTGTVITTGTAITTRIAPVLSWAVTKPTRLYTIRYVISTWPLTITTPATITATEAAGADRYTNRTMAAIIPVTTATIRLIQIQAAGYAGYTPAAVAATALIAHRHLRRRLERTRHHHRAVLPAAAVVAAAAAAADQAGADSLS